MIITVFEKGWLLSWGAICLLIMIFVIIKATIYDSLKEAERYIVKNRALMRGNERVIFQIQQEMQGVQKLQNTQQIEECCKKFKQELEEYTKLQQEIANLPLPERQEKWGYGKVLKKVKADWPRLYDAMTMGSDR